VCISMNVMGSMGSGTEVSVSLTKLSACPSFSSCDAPSKLLSGILPVFL